MKKPQNSIYSLPAPVYTPGSQMLIVSGSLYQNSKTGVSSCRLKFQSLCSQILKAVIAELVFYDVSDHPLGESISFSFSVGKLNRDDVFGESQEIPVPYTDAASFHVWVRQVIPEREEPLFFPESSARFLYGRKTLEEGLENENMAEQFRVRYGSDCRYLRTDEADLWYCVCGGINSKEENACHCCRRPQRALKDINLDSLRAEAEKRRKREETQNEAESSKPRDFHKWKRFAFILVPVFLVLILLIATVPGALRRESRYRTAIELLEQGNLDEAEEAFAAVPTYRDSDDILNQRIPYLRALRILEAAKAGDSAMLQQAGHSRSEINETTTASMLLYDAAAQAFDALEDYQDSASLASQCRDAIDSEMFSLKEAEYQAAVALLESKHYSEAARAFEDMDEFYDSKTMIQECSYRKAISLCQFVETHDISRIYASLSDIPGEASVFSIPESETVRLGSGCVSELRAACGKDEVEIRLEDTPSDTMLSFKEALSAYFLELGSYKDSAEYPARIEQLTDYTKEFFDMCEAGSLYEALSWLEAYDGEFPDRTEWTELLNLYLPYCNTWYLHSGDPSLVSYSVWQNFPCNTLRTEVLLTSETATLRLLFGDDLSMSFDLPSAVGETLFINSEQSNGSFMAAINVVGRLAYMCYDSDGNQLSSSEYELAV
ncbi:MAG: hypothetical protein K6C08_11155 [Oscillospiraceae bacterium]|nr:hypothetical protein [Oscillospiraceae bacterium]